VRAFGGFMGAVLGLNLGMTVWALPAAAASPAPAAPASAANAAPVAVVAPAVAPVDAAPEAPAPEAVPAAAPKADQGVALFRESGPPIVIAEGDAQVEVTQSGDRWWVTGTDGRRRLADGKAVQALMAYLDGLFTVRPVASFGHPPPDAFARPLTITRAKDVVRVGGPSRIPGLDYVRRGDGSLHLMRPVSLKPSDLQLVDRRLFPDGLGAIDEIDLTGPDIAVHATRRFGPWRLTAPSPSAADGRAIDRWLERLGSLQGDPSDAPPSPDKAYQIVATAVDGRTLKLTLAPDGRVLLGDVPFEVDGGLKGLIPKRFDWMEKQVLNIPGDAITGIQVQQAERTVVLSRRVGGPWVDKDSGRVYQAWGAELFSLLAPLPAVGLWGDAPDALGTAEVEVRLWQDRDLVSTIELWMGKDGRWWARGGGEVAVYQIGDALPAHLARLF
jgi:hypothetical protein